MVVSGVVPRVRPGRQALLSEQQVPARVPHVLQDRSQESAPLRVRHVQQDLMGLLPAPHYAPTAPRALQTPQLARHKLQTVPRA